MIRYTLKCADGHDFDSWFADAAGYEALKSAGQISCPICGNASVEKALMAPAVRSGRKAAELTNQPDTTEKPAINLDAPASAVEAALTKLRQAVEANSEYVGVNFAQEARKIHEGSAPERSIYGETKPDEARQLIEEGIAVTPLPFLPSRKTN